MQKYALRFKIHITQKIKTHSMQKSFIQTNSHAKISDKNYLQVTKNYCAKKI